MHAPSSAVDLWRVPLQQSGELKIHLAVLEQGASMRAASSPLAASVPERQPDLESQPASPSASAAAEAEALAREAMSAVQAEDLALAQQLMAKAARLMPAEYAEALELIEAAQRSVGSESDAPVEPVAAAAAASSQASPHARPVTSPPEPSASGSSRKAHKNKHRARTPPAAVPPAAAETEPAAAAEEEIDPEVLQQLTLEVAAAALWHLWSEFLTEYLPLLADAAGLADGEAYMRGALAADSPTRNRVLACATAAVIFAGCLGAVAALMISRQLLSLLASALTFCWQLVVATVRGITWDPKWYLAFPACAVAGVQTRSPLVSLFWAAPAWWWLLGGRMWAVLGSALCFGSLVIFGRINYLISVFAWTLLRGAFAFSSWWIRVPAVLIVLAAWAFVSLLWLQFLANAEVNATAPPGELPVDVPKDADGEVARILGCRTYYAVLELDENTDEEAVRKAHRRKGAHAASFSFQRHTLRRPLAALLVHPDKCSSPYAKAAFQRVQDGFMLLKGAPRLRMCVAEMLTPLSYHGRRQDFEARIRRPSCKRGACACHRHYCRRRC